MAVIKEWKCATHGVFDGTHPICPHLGCASESVERAFLTAPGFKSDSTKRFDAGIRKSADGMHIGNFRSARAGEAAYGGHVSKEVGQEVLWGTDVQAKLGRSFTDLTRQAQQPFVYEKPTGEKIVLERNNAMREAATEMGITQRRLPVAERTVAKVDSASLKSDA